MKMVSPQKKHGAETFEKIDFVDVHIYNNNMFPGCSHNFLDFLRCPGLSKDKQSWFAGPVTS